MELRGTRVLIDAGLGLAASARLVRGEVERSGDDESDVDVDASKKKRKSRRHRRATGRGEFLISPPAYRTALFEVRELPFLRGEKRDRLPSFSFSFSFCSLFFLLDDGLHVRACEGDERRVSGRPVRRRDAGARLEHG